MDLKCSLSGVVDVIFVEELGKFFDINLVEVF